LAPLVRTMSKHVADAAPLASQACLRHIGPLVHCEEPGHPFFVISSLFALAEEDLLFAFESHGLSRLDWDLGRTTPGLHLKRGGPDGGNLPACPGDPGGLQWRRLLGNVADTPRASPWALETSDEACSRALWDALAWDSVERLPNDCLPVLHDRVSGAAYSLNPPSSRAELHLLIGPYPAGPGRRPNQRDGRRSSTFSLSSTAGAPWIVGRGPPNAASASPTNLDVRPARLAFDRLPLALSYLVSVGSLLTNGDWSAVHELMFRSGAATAPCTNARC